MVLAHVSQQNDKCNVLGILESKLVNPKKYHPIQPWLMCRGQGSKRSSTVLNLAGLLCHSHDQHAKDAAVQQTPPHDWLPPCNCDFTDARVRRVNRWGLQIAWTYHNHWKIKIGLVLHWITLSYGVVFHSRIHGHGNREVELKTLPCNSVLSSIVNCWFSRRTCLTWIQCSILSKYSKPQKMD